MLVPREIDPFAKWRHVPLPPPKPDDAVASEPARTPAAESPAVAPRAAEPVPLPVPAPKKTGSRRTEADPPARP